jgi:hypothetical protein
MDGEIKSAHSILFDKTLGKRLIGIADTFYLRVHNEFFGYFVEQWLENEEIPVVLWSCINLT